MKKFINKLFITLLIVFISFACFNLNVKAALNDNGVQRLIYFVSNCKYNSPEKECGYRSTAKERYYNYADNDSVVSIIYNEESTSIWLYYFLFTGNKTEFVTLEFDPKNYNKYTLAVVGTGSEDLNKYDRLAYAKFDIKDYTKSKNYTFQLQKLVEPFDDLGKTSTQENSILHKGIAKINEILSKDLNITLGDLGWSKMPKSNIDKIYSFVSRLYSLCLNRKADQGGLNYYVHSLCSGEYTAAQVVKNFYNSPEMKNLKLNDQQFIERCYKAMMDRNSDAGGMKYWKSILDKGVSRIYVVRGFVESQEFTNICKNYGVTKGSVSLDENRDKNIGVTEFIARCYTKALGRSFDAGGLNYYTGIIDKSNNKKQEAINIASKNFFNSPEFLNKNTNNEQFIKICYRTFLGREAEGSGLEYYLNRIKSGVSRSTLLSNFANSPEFNNIMAQYGIK